ncbi:membrane protein insertase YidC [Paucibacter sp. O1-1]|uniref:membrane protein insertase YidC n=1 Tax=Paucibacter sp. M5-1 TaxID=3015998 RepID=UPI0010F48A0C|nr:membrane protein insertase YidC [Paucibacter sp. M5-1]MCU7374843.1 membrane protein insertase YidC [Paucibacter sp. O1-1]MCZ7881934.1 membrane protein insertase YidC [Paucibacter sp. M5-1]MDA3829845.1 membrane protein insertase YidC [Paucibacter sp. O1-1]
MTDIRRTVLWVVFTMSLVLLWDGWQKHNGHPSMFSPAAPKPAAVAGSAPGAAALPTAATLPGAAATPGAAPTAAAPSSTGETVVISTDVVKATLDSLGGSLVRVELLKHKDETDASGHIVVLDRSAQRVYLAQTGLVGVAGAPSHLTPMSLVPGERSLKDGEQSLVVRFESPEQGGVKLVKTYTFKRGDYAVDVKHEVLNTSAAPLTPQLYTQLVRDGNPLPNESSFYFTFTGPAMYTDKSKFLKLDFKDIEKGKASVEKNASDGWVAMVQHYFASAWLHKGDSPREFYAKKVDNNLYSVGMLFPLAQLAPGASVSADHQLFVGPQEENKLAVLAPGLELVKDYGWFTILSKPLFWLLDQLHKLLGNWGWSIIALVVLLKIAFYWLNASAYRSMAKMKAVNPRITEMRERLKDKPQQMQQEMMKIYREEKINPIGSCLPIFLQMPFFIALYWVLLSSVEMRHAPWILWITDLSAKDPFFVLPILMTLSSLFQVWLNPTPPDPMQAKMMWIMPLAFSFMFFFFPAGLVLYWLTNNILSIAQQWMINRQLGVNK